MPTLVLLRHGESTWNKENRFTGWTDVDLSETGLDEAHEAGRLLRAEVVSLRRRPHVGPEAGDPDALDRRSTSSTRCGARSATAGVSNERHYGALQGLNKAEMAVKFGEAQVKLWRRSYDVPPPALADDDEQFPGRDPRYADLPDADVPRAESLKDTVARFLPYWESTIAPDLRAGKRVLVAAHGNSLRALVKYLDGVSDEEIVGLNIPTGAPLVYDLDDALRPRSSRYLGDPSRVAAAMAAVAAQGAAKPAG